MLLIFIFDCVYTYCRRNCSTSASGQTTSTTSGPAQVSDCVSAEDIEKLKKLLDEKSEYLENFQIKVNELEVCTLLDVS